MHTRTISGHVDHTVTLGTAHYARAVTITPSGSIGADFGDNGIVTIPRTGHASVFNAGTVQGGDGISNARANGTNAGIGIDLSCAGNVINNGVILGGHGGYGNYAGGAGGAGLVFATGGHFSNTSTIGGGFGGGASYEDSSAGNGGLGVQLGANVHAQNSGLIYGGQGGIDTDVVDPQGASGAGGAGLVLSITGTGAIELGAGAFLALAGGTVSIASIVFGAGGGETLYLGAPASVSSTLSGFGTGDRIALANTLATSLSYANGTLTLFDAHHNIVDTLAFAGDYNIGSFALQPEGQTTDVVYAGSEARVHVTWPHADDLPGPLAWLHR